MGWGGEEGSCNCVNKSIVSFAISLFLTHQHKPWTISLEVRLQDAVSEKNTCVSGNGEMQQAVGRYVHAAGILSLKDSD